MSVRIRLSVVIVEIDVYYGRSIGTVHSPLLLLFRPGFNPTWVAVER
jgi:hypothetical protein